MLQKNKYCDVLCATLLLSLMMSVCRPIYVKATTLDSVGLDQAYQAALKNLERLAITDERLTQAEERYKQARGSILPSVDFIGAYQRQQPRKATGTAAAFAINEQTTLRLALRQPLLQGFREYAGLNQASSLKHAARYDRIDAARLVYNDVAEVFLTIRSVQSDIKNLNDQVAYTKKRRDELASRQRIGRSRASEVLPVDMRLKNLAADLADAQGRLSAAREMFSFMTALPLSVELKDDLALINTATGVESLLKQGLKRPDVVAADYRAEAALSGIWVARGGHFPTVDLAGNYYFKRPGVLQDVHWDVTLGFTLPLFQGGVIAGATAEAAAAARETAKTSHEVKRRSELEIKTAHANLSAQVKRLGELTEVSALSKKNYEVQQSEYRLGLVSNIEVLQALESWIVALRTHNTAYYQALLEQVRLETATGVRGKIEE